MIYLPDFDTMGLKPMRDGGLAAGMALDEIRDLFNASRAASRAADEVRRLALTPIFMGR